MIYQLVLQFDASSIEDFDRGIEIEDKIINALGNAHDVDGHDFGSGEMNIFIHTDEPKEAFKILKANVLPNFLKEVKAAFRELSSENYTVLWPEGYSGEFNIK